MCSSYYRTCPELTAVKIQVIRKIGFQKENFEYLSYTDIQFAALQRPTLRVFWLQSTSVDFNVSISGGKKSIQKVR